LLTADLEVLDAASLPCVAPAIRSALDYADEILRETDLLNLIGPLYVLEGSQSDAIALKHEYARCLNIPDEQLSYLGCYGRATAARWNSFWESLALFPSMADNESGLQHPRSDVSNVSKGFARQCTPAPLRTLNIMRPQ
jgi:hypothetical protein